MKKRMVRALVAACMAGTVSWAAALETAPFLTGELFDLTLGVGSTYDPATDTVTGGSVSAPVGFSTVPDLFDTISSTTELQRINGLYTDTSPAVIRLGYRGLPIVVSSPAGSPAVQFSVPAIGESVTFSSGATRDENLDQLEEYLKNSGADLLTRMQNALVRVSPVDPVAGNPGSLQTQMVNDDFDRSFLAFASNVAEGQAATNNLIGIGAEFNSFTSGGVRTNSVTIPLSYVVRADADPRRQFTFYAPITVTQVDQAYSGSVRLGASYRYPITDRWALTPGIGYGVTGSVDLGAAAAMMAASLTSHYALKFRGFDVAIGNAVGVYKAHKVSSRDYSFSPDIRNTVFRNGILLSVPTTAFGMRMAYEVSYINTIYNGTELYSNKYNEIGLTLGTNRSASSSRSFLRAGLSLYKGEKDVKGGRINIGYWF